VKAGRLDLIINADDLGISEENTAATASLMERGRVTSATILANGEDLESAVNVARSLPRCSFGVHLNLTEGPPLTDSSRLSPLLGEDGQFTRLVFSEPLAGPLLSAVEEEWVAQVEKVRATGLRVTHLDSHEHVHTIPRLFFAFKAVQRRTGIRKARITKNLYDSSSPPGSSLVLVKKRAWTFALRHYLRTRTTEGFSDFGSFFRAAKERPLHLRNLEVMVHPAAGDEFGFREEIELLETDWEKELPFQVRLLSFHQLS
jgi:predicted glycoside hydrolase/deacetylase ChbG (UPF0249 family)